MAEPLFGGTQKSSTIMVYKPLMAGPRLYSDETALVKDGGGFAMALPVDAREAIPPSHGMNVIRCQWARLGLEPTKTGNRANVRPSLFSISCSPVPHISS